MVLAMIWGCIMEKHILSVLVRNSSGVLTRVSGLFSRRGFNIDSLTVGRTEEEDISRMTIVIAGDMEVVEVEPGLADGHFPAPGIVKRVVRLLGERHTPQLLPIFGLQDERGRRGPAAARDQDMKCAGLVLLQRAEGRFELRKLAVE